MEETDERDPSAERDAEFSNPAEAEALEKVVHVSGMYREWFLDYASYVILERAVPHLNDGLKPVQRRILHSMWEMDDGRYHKVANIIGNTMKFHPHGDASIGDALVQMGQKDLLIDCQGNWGNTLTGDSAAAPRYIEARLTKFALEVLFNPKTTTWLASYDGRNREPLTLPVKFPLLLATGAEGIAVGLACKILPHNFNELIDASIAHLKGVRKRVYPDFATGGIADFSEYNDGLRGGRIKVRARITADDKKTLRISEIPFGTTTSSLIDSILKANDKGKIKIRKVDDNTAEQVEILIHLQPNVSPDKTIDALYAFSDCEMSISPNACVIENDRPRFMGVSDMLAANTDQCKALLLQELEIRKAELEEQYLYESLEKIFIEKRIYRDIEECETWDEIIATIHRGLAPHTAHLIRAVTDEDVARLTEIKIKRISRFDSFKAEEHLAKLEAEMAEVKHHIEHITDYAIEYFKNLKKKYGEGRERRTEIRQIEIIERTTVAANNVKLYVDRAEGFVGHGLKRADAELVCEASDIDDVIVIRSDGKLVVTRMADKTFVGKDILYVNVWQRDDERTTYNLVYQDGPGGHAMVKRFHVTSVIRDKEYDLSRGTERSRVLHLSVNPNGEAEVLSVLLRAKPALKKLRFEFDFSSLAIRGRAAAGVILSRHAVNRIEVKEKGVSTLGARQVWFDESVQRLNYEERGRLLGAFGPDDKVICFTTAGTYRMTGIDVSTKFDDNLLLLEKWSTTKAITAIYLDGARGEYYVKRFLAESSDKPVSFISEHPESKLVLLSTAARPQAQVKFDQRAGARPDEVVDLEQFIAVKGLKAQGNRLTKFAVKAVVEIEPLPAPAETEQEAQPMDDGEPSNAEPAEETGADEASQLPVADSKSASDSPEPPKPPAGGKDSFTIGSQITLEL